MLVSWLYLPNHQPTTTLSYCNVTRHSMPAKEPLCLAVSDSHQYNIQISSLH